MVVPVSGSAAFAAPAAQGSAGGQKSLASGDFETFLRMLTAQLKNQDPLNPMEGSDFAVQLATFSGVEQQAQTNSLLSSLTQQMGGGVGQLSDWLGREVRVTGPVWFSDRPLTLDINPDPRADSVQLVTLTAGGRELMREEIGVGEGQVDWFGHDALGNKMPDGLYTYRVESWQNGDKIAEAEVGSYARVLEAELARGGVQLVLEGGAMTMADEVQAVRDPRVQ
ncbi:flagellar hook capping FlgD N-terminal domain-containing protein [Paracoccus tegillarcae]|uniref:Basal-body rod modification protein FlgD n=1 Tax=Paracoccus tegillarcae TaxID=1529068 RepID=A0A2K9EZ69_9RHOB|nr:flagellar hook capping FlgD N-terminal domain-containing protein [Paracoccus tegillarcae]AUH33402.1 flagellar basal body rod modification protein [Paracoccus tegillarcae]